jgi:hypothetical protein
MVDTARPTTPNRYHHFINLGGDDLIAPIESYSCVSSNCSLFTSFMACFDCLASSAGVGGAAGLGVGAGVGGGDGGVFVINFLSPPVAAVVVVLLVGGGVPVGGGVVVGGFTSAKFLNK